MADVDLALEADSFDIATPTRLVTGLALVAQRIRVRLALHRGDVLRDGARGLPWIEWFGQKPLPLATIRARIRREIESVPGVASVVEVTASVDRAGFLTIGAEVTTADGEISVRSVVADGGTRNMSFGATIRGWS